MKKLSKAFNYYLVGWLIFMISAGWAFSIINHEIRELRAAVSVLLLLSIQNTQKQGQDI